MTADSSSDEGFVGAMGVNGYPFKRVNGEWVPDEDARDKQLRRECAEQKVKDDLIWALRTRVLTADEMDQVRRLGTRLLIRMNGGMSQGYNQNELEKRLNDLLLTQFGIQQLAK